MAQNGRRSGDEGLIAALAAGCSNSEAARRADVAERTLYRRLADPEFRLRVDQARAELLHQTIGKLSALGEQCADELKLLIESGKPNVKLGAIRTVLTYLFAGHEQFGSLRRIEELEAMLAKVEGRDP